MRKFADNNFFGQFMMNVANFKITLQSFICRPYVKLTISTLITRLKSTKAWTVSITIVTRDSNPGRLDVESASGLSAIYGRYKYDQVLQ